MRDTLILYRSTQGRTDDVYDGDTSSDMLLEITAMMKQMHVDSAVDFKNIIEGNVPETITEFDKFQIQFPNFLVFRRNEGILSKHFCKSNDFDDDNRPIDPITLEPIDDLLVGVPNEDSYPCYQRESLLKYLENERSNHGYIERRDPVNRTKFVYDTVKHLLFDKNYKKGDLDMSIEVQTDDDGLIFFFNLYGYTPYDFTILNWDDFSYSEQSTMLWYVKAVANKNVLTFMIPTVELRATGDGTVESMGICCHFSHPHKVDVPHIIIKDVPPSETAPPIKVTELEIIEAETAPPSEPVRWWEQLYD